MHGEFDIPDADEWLANLANVTVGWPNDSGTVVSAPTSMATNTQMARGNIYKACRCLEHQEIYDNWPTRHAKLTIAHCMKICMYCGKDFPVASALRKHLSLRVRLEYIERSLRVRLEKTRWGAPTPEWTPRLHRTRSCSPRRIPRNQAIRSRYPTDSPDAGLYL